MVCTSISRGKRITSDILRFGRPAQLSLRSVDVRDLLRKAADEIRPLLPEGVRLNLELPEAPLYAHADSAQLSQVLINLGLNARDAMQGKSGTLTLGARPGQHAARSVSNISNSEDFIHINVTDTGEGISAEDLPFIFEPLFTTKKTGTGLGLSVVYQVVTGHGGHIFVDTKRDIGTTFHLFVPASLEESAAVTHQTTEGQTSPPKPRVLIVEDEQAIATGLRWTLEAEGMTVHVVGLAAEVVPAVEAFKPDVLLLDLSLPDGDGRTVYKQIAGRLPVIFSTGSLGEHDLVASGHGNVAVLLKPYTGDELLRTIYQTLHSEEADA
jgi:CheY-like chemotaxis protein